MGRLAPVRRLVGQGIPFVYMPVGGQARPIADPARLRHLKLLVSTHAEADLPADAVAALGIRRDALDAAGVASATWNRLGGSAKVDAEVAPKSPHVFFTLPGCSLRGVLDLRLAQN